MLLAIIAIVIAVLVALSLLPGWTPRIDTRLHPKGLAVLEDLPVNDSRQWVLIRTHDVANPIVLLVHGGPGTSQLTQMRKVTKPLETRFTVVNWDQRGAGKSFTAGRDASRMNMAQFVDDLIAVATLLARRLHQDKILLVGHSWGSTIGMLAVAKRPDLFSGYVGIGQMSNPAEGDRVSYEWTLQQARTAGDRASEAKLVAMGPMPYTGANWQSKFMTERRLLGKFGGEYHGSRTGAFGVVLRSLVFSSEYTLLDRINFFRGIFRSVALLYQELLRHDLFVEVPDVRVPVYFCLGRHDYEVPSTLAAEYFKTLRAPQKQLVWFEESAHLPNTEEADTFNEFMIATVWPTVREVALAEV